MPYRKSHRGHAAVSLLAAGVLIVVAVIGIKVYQSDHSGDKNNVSTKITTPSSSSPDKTLSSSDSPAKSATTVNQCASNNLSQLILVSIGQRHMWACDGNKAVYDNAVITGMANLAADLTPTGTYHIYSKITNTTLTGHDSTGSWSDPVSYWMPFLHNQYGSYGFHDATWRAPTDFGNISPDSSNASHGCVEMPLAAAKWLYGWASVGTTVTIES